ncbi:uncharacterized protein C3orf38 homolog isoform X1 [Carcharodon carcharias]|uniref:uncharacterized protein C3orf38 homolog isoform X1 n=1 Tax=Carcharodon carcharias TaxID=13397 RepID=UPI001B7E8B32|nr:uncharacterized protein C3orf38 homolog isoform X1 [Carcharodon carcharias]
MLSEREQCGCRELLQILAQGELISVADTVTNRMLKIENSAEAMDAILCYSQSAEELLKRKKIHREIIFQYLAKHNIVVPCNAEKHQLVQKVIEYWREGGTASQKNNSSGSTSGNNVPPHDVAANYKYDYQAMGLEFCKWFYQLLNSQNPLLQEQSKEWGPQHFWEDVILKFSYRTSEQQLEVYTGAVMVSLRLLALTKEEHLFLNPNLTGSGLKCIHSPHGLVIIAVAGTIHRESICLGIFEQIFGLIRCPSSENNWKMKFVHLKITGHGAAAQVAVQPNEDADLPIIKYESNELLQVFEEHTVGICD